MKPIGYLLLCCILAAGSCRQKEANPYESTPNGSIGGTDETYRSPLATPRSLFIDDGGSGDTAVIFVHSFAGSTKHWETALALTRKKRRAIAFDMRAHGNSPAAADNDYSIDGFANDIQTVVDSLQLSHVILVGQNLGAQAAMAYAARFPGKVNGLLLMGVPLKTTATRVTKIMDQLESDQYDSVTNSYLNYLLINAQPPTGDLLKEGLNKLSKNGVRKMVRGSLNYDAVAALKKYTGPVLMLCTRDDQAVATWQQLFPKNSYRIIERSSHWVQLDRPSLFNDILQKFLMDLPRS